jgi:arylsulfatase
MPKTTPPSNAFTSISATAVMAIFKSSILFEIPRPRNVAIPRDGSKKTIYGPNEFVGGEMSGGKWMRQGDLKAVTVPKPCGTGEWELYDVAKDPGEANDLSKTKPAELKELVAAWDKYAGEVGVIPPE